MMNARMNQENGIDQTKAMSSDPISAMPTLQVVSAENKVISMEEFVKMTGANEALIEAAAKSPRMPRFTPGIVISVVGAASAWICLAAEYASIPIKSTPTTVAIATAFLCACIGLSALCCLILPIYWTFCNVKINRFLNSTGKGAKANSVIAGVLAFLLANGALIMSYVLMCSAFVLSAISRSLTPYIDHQIQAGQNAHPAQLMLVLSSLVIVLGGMYAMSVIQVLTSTSIFKSIAARIDPKMPAAVLRQVKFIGLGCGALFAINSLYASLDFLPGKDSGMDYVLGVLISGNLAMLASFAGLNYVCREIKG